MVRVTSWPFDEAVQRQLAAAAEQGSPSGGQNHYIPSLNGIRGLMILIVVLSHLFAEVPGGIRILAIGGMALDVLFVLTGFLVGQLVLDRGARSNFFTVFLVRRLCRTLPIYFACVITAIAVFSSMPSTVTNSQAALPLWSYLTFTQNLFMAARDSFGQPWLAPTWTIVVALQFYVVAPALLLFTPYRSIVPVLLAVAVMAVLFRAGIYAMGVSPIAAEVLLPGKLDALACGMIAAAMLHRLRIDWEEYEQALRMAPVALLALLVGICSVSMPGEAVYEVLGRSILALVAAALLLMVAKGALKLSWAQARPLRIFGSVSYAVFLLHLPMLWIAHGVVYGAKPELDSLGHWAVTAAALVGSIAVGWLLTCLLDATVTSYRRTWVWSDHARQTTRRGIAAIKPRLGRTAT